MLRKVTSDVAKRSPILRSRLDTAFSIGQDCYILLPLSTRTAQASCLASSAFSTESKDYTAHNTVHTTKQALKEARLFSSNPVSLASPRFVEAPREGVEDNWFTRSLLRICGFYSQESKNLRAAKAWYECIEEQATDKRLLKVLGLKDNFGDTYSMLCLHMWLCLVRLRTEDKAGKALAQVIYENFQEDVELRVRAAGVKVKLSKHLMDLEQRFYGSSLAYDQALNGKEELSNALFRNVYGQDPDRKKFADVLDRYIKRELACLKITDSEAIMTGRVSYSQGFLDKKKEGKAVGG